MNMKKLTALIVIGVFVVTLIPIISMNATSDPFGANRAIISTLYDQYDVEVDIDGSGGTAKIFATWTDYKYSMTPNYADISFSKSTDGGLVWSSPTRINTGDLATNTSNEGAPCIAYDPSVDNVYIAWLDLSHGDTLIYFKRSTNGGTSWSNEIAISPSCSGSAEPKIAASGGDVFVTYMGKNTEGAMCVKSSDAGSSFSAPKTVLAHVDGQFIENPDIAVDDTNVYVVYEVPGVAWEKQDIRCSRSARAGTLDTWSHSPVTSSSDSQESYPSVAADSSGVCVAWVDYRNTPEKEHWGDVNKDNGDIFFARSTNQGSSFSSSIRVVDDNKDKVNHNIQPSVDIKPDGKAVVAWTDARNGKNDKDIYFAVGDENGFSTNGRVNEFQIPSAHQYGPSVAVDTSGIPYIAWSDERDYATKHTDVYISHTVTNTAPNAPTLKPPTQFQKDSMLVEWDPNIESDFVTYELHKSTSPGFTIDATTLNYTFDSQATTEVTVEGLSPGTTYYYKLRIYDFDGLYSDSNEVNGKTEDINQIPIWLKDIEDFTIPEDDVEAGKYILNLSDGYFTDDYYNGFPVTFDIHTAPDNDNIIGSVEQVISGNDTFWYASFRPAVNFVGTEEFWFNLSDLGDQGTTASPNRLHNISNTFSVTTTAVNDAPKFDKMYYGIWEGDISNFQNKVLNDELLKGRQGEDYEFTILAEDVDEGDSLTYKWKRIIDENNSIDMDDPTENAGDPDLAADFVFTPTNDDATNVDGISGMAQFNISAKDSGNKEIYFYLTIYLRNANDPPEIVKLIDINDGEKEIDTTAMTSNYEFEIDEGDVVQFQLQGIDLDPKDKPTFMTEKPQLNLDRSSTFVADYNGEPVTYYSANFTYTPSDEDILAEGVEDVKIYIDDKNTGIDEFYFDIKIRPVNDPPEPPKIFVEALYENNDLLKDWQQKNIGSMVDLNPNEEINFSALAKDPDLDPLTYNWDFGDGETGDGHYVLHSFDDVGNYTINCSVSDGEYSAYTTMLVVIQSDNDYDNDELEDDWEMKHFGNLDQGPDDDPDEDDVSNYKEYRQETDPNRDNSLPPIGETTSTGEKEKGLPAWAILLIIIAVVAAIFGIIVFIVIKKQDYQLEAEDKKMEEWANKQMKKLEETKAIYGTMMAGQEAQGKAGGPSADMEKLEQEASMFMAGAETGNMNIDGDIGGVKGATPEMETATGPLFDESAPKLQFAEDAGISLDGMESVHDDDDLVIETVTLGMQEDSEPELQPAQGGAPGAIAAPEPQQQLQPPPQMQPAPGQPPQQPQGQPPQQQ